MNFVYAIMNAMTRIVLGVAIGLLVISFLILAFFGLGFILPLVLIGVMIYALLERL